MHRLKSYYGKFKEAVLKERTSRSSIGTTAGGQKASISSQTSGILTGEV